MRDETKTAVIARAAETCEDTEDVRAMLRLYDGYYVSWQKHLVRLLDESGLSYAKFAERCALSKNTVKKWCTQGGAPRSRSTCLKIAFGLDMDAAETSRLLVRYGGYHGLYAKDLFDACCIFLLDRKTRARYDDAVRLFNRCAQDTPAPTADPLSTVVAREQIAEAQTERDFVAFTRQYGAALARRNEKLSVYLRDLLTARIRTGVGDAESVHAYFSDNCIPARYEKLVSQICTHGLTPRRETLLALGIHLELTPEELSELLRRAGMEGLCAKNRLECVILYALRQLCLLHPELPLSNAMQLLAVTQDEQTAGACRSIVQEYTETQYHCAADDAVSVADEVRRLLAALDLEEAGELLALL